MTILNLLHNVNINCPYCNAMFSTTVDTSTLQQNYIEDCQICCAPIVFDISVDFDSLTPEVFVRREDE